MPLNLIKTLAKTIHWYEHRAKQKLKLILKKSDDKDDIYENIEEFDSDKERKVLIVFDEKT